MNLSRGHLFVLGLIAVSLIILFGTSMVGIAQSTDGSDAPAIPATYYGEITINGAPASDGTTIEAHIDGEVRGTIVIDEDGEYGGAAAADEKLTVDGTFDDDGEEITFYIDADGFETGEADQTSIWESGSLTELKLTASLDASNGGNGNGGGTGGGGGGGAAPMPPTGDEEEDESEEEPPVIETERVEIPEPDETGERKVVVEQTSVSEVSLFDDDDESDERDSEPPTEITVTESSAVVEGTTKTYTAVDIDTGDADTSQMRGAVTMEIPIENISDAENTLQMYRNASVETGWEPLETTVEIHEDVYRITGETPGFSTFAVAEVVEQDPSDQSDGNRSDEETSVENSETKDEEQSPSETEESDEDKIRPEDVEDQVGFTIITGITALLLTYFIIREE